jgi:hypothetical protein
MAYGLSLCHQNLWDIHRPKAALNPPSFIRQSGNFLITQFQPNGALLQWAALSIHHPSRNLKAVAYASPTRLDSPHRANTLFAQETRRDGVLALGWRAPVIGSKTAFLYVFNLEFPLLCREADSLRPHAFPGGIFEKCLNLSHRKIGGEHVGIDLKDNPVG